MNNNGININTGNPIVDRVGQLDLIGNLIPEAWYKTITNDKSQADVLSIMILAEIVYWYRPAVEKNGKTTTYKKKFQDKDYIQKSYDQLMDKLNITKAQARNHILALEKLGVIKRELRTIPTARGPLPNVMFIQLNTDVLEKLTFPEDKNISILKEGCVYNNIDTPIYNETDISTINNTSDTNKDNTNTEITEENNSYNTITTLSDTVVVNEIKSLFSDYNFGDDTIKAISAAAGYDLEKCNRAKDLMEHQNKDIANPAGWLIAALKNNYSPAAEYEKHTPQKTTFSTSGSHKYDYDVLEAEGLAWLNFNCQK